MKPGDVVGGRFELERQAAQGGMGVVYRAIDRQTGGLAAVKTVSSADTANLPRFRREAEALAMLRDRHIVEYLAHGAGEDGEPFLAMEWLEGEDLGSRLGVAEVAHDDAILLAQQVAGALAAAHARGIVHRDIKPANIFLVDWRVDRVKVLDFGVARLTSGDRLTATGMRIGTPSYMAPEQVRGDGAVDARTDIYALGVVLFRCLSRKLPFTGGSSEEVFARVLGWPAPRLRDLVPMASGALDDLLARMLAKDPARRPADGRALALALAAIDHTTPLAAPAPAAAPPERDRLVGRQAECAAIADFLAGPGGRVLLVTGEPGIGKSRLLDEAAALTSGAVLRGRAFEAEMVRPYGPWIDALRAGLFPEILGGADGGDRAKLYDGVVRALAGAAEGRALTVLLDDVHWLDEASAALLHYLARGLAETRVRFVAGARPVELADNRAATRVMRALGRDQRLAELAVGPLGEADIAALAGGVDPERVFAESEGNPFFALEIANALRRGQTASANLDALLDDRLEQLESEARELLTWAAALGRSFDLDTLGLIVGGPVSALLAAAEVLERRGVVRPAAAGYDFAHDLLRAAAYRRLSEPRRRAVHLHIARVVAAAHPDGAWASQIAHHADLGGDDELAVRSAVVAGERCLSVFANAEAAALAERALGRTSRLPRLTAIPLEIALFEILCLSGRWTGRAAELSAAVARVVVEARATGMNLEVQRGLHVVGLINYFSHDFDRAYTATDQAAAVPAGDASRALALACGARCMVHLERELPRAAMLLDEARALADQSGAAPLDLPLGEGMLAYFDGRWADAATRLETAWRQAHASGDRWRECEALAHLVRVELERHRLDAAIGWCGELRPVAAGLGEGSEAPFAAALEALARVAAGEAGADAEVQAAIDRLTEMDCKHQLAYVLNACARQDLDRGRVEAAAARARRAIALAEAADRPGEAVMARALLAKTDLARGARDSAERSITALRDQLTPERVSARSVAAVREVADELGIPTPR